MGDLRELADTLLAQSVVIDLSATVETVLFTCPVGKNCVITKIIMFDVSAAITAAEISFGWDTGDADDVVAIGTVQAVSAAAKYRIIPPDVAQPAEGTPGDEFSMDVNVAEGAADTAKFAAFGFLYDA